MTRKEFYEKVKNDSTLQNRIQTLTRFQTSENSNNFTDAIERELSMISFAYGGGETTSKNISDFLENRTDAENKIVSGAFSGEIQTT